MAHWASLARIDSGWAAVGVNSEERPVTLVYDWGALRVEHSAS